MDAKKEAPVQEPIQFDLSLIAPHERFAFWHDVGSLIHRPLPCRDQSPADLKVHAKL
jgi:hypothetical protein